MSSVFRYYENPPIHQVGDTKMSAMPFDHAGWLICDGRLLDKEYYNNLYGIIGNAFGENEEGTHFRIPNGSGRVAAAIGQAAPGMNNWQMGNVYGEEMHQLTIAEMPSHSHTNNSATNSLGLMTQNNQNTAINVDNSNEPNVYQSVQAVVINSTGGSQPHNNIQPTIYVGNMFIYGGF